MISTHFENEKPSYKKLLGNFDKKNNDVRELIWSVDIDKNEKAVAVIRGGLFLCVGHIN